MSNTVATAAFWLNELRTKAHAREAEAYTTIKRAIAEGWDLDTLRVVLYDPQALEEASLCLLLVAFIASEQINDTFEQGQEGGNA